MWNRSPEKKQFSMQERMEIIALLNDLMKTEKGNTFALGPVAAFVEALPYIPLRFKWPFFGEKKDGKNVEGLSPGFGNVSVPDKQSESPRADPKKYPDSRFGIWDIAHTIRGVYIDHMWSHHVLSPKFRNMCGLLLVRRDTYGAIDAAVLLRQHESRFLWDLWKYSDNLSPEEVDAWMLKINPPQPQIVGRPWLPVLLAYLLIGWGYDVELMAAGHHMHAEPMHLVLGFLGLDLLNYQVGACYGWKFSFGSVIIGSVILVHLLLLLPYVG